MTHSIEKRQQFKVMRAHGRSFARIEEDIDVPKSTLWDGSREDGEEIDNLRATVLQAMLERYGLALQQEIETLARLLEKVTQEINARDFSKVPLKDLVSMRGKWRENLLLLIKDEGITTHRLLTDPAFPGCSVEQIRTQPII